MNICKSIDPSRKERSSTEEVKHPVTRSNPFTTCVAVYVDKGTLRNKHIRQRHCRRIRSRAKKVGDRYFCCRRYFAVTLNNVISPVSQHFSALFFNIYLAYNYLVRKKMRKYTRQSSVDN